MKLIANGKGSGSIADRLLAVDGDVDVLRPYIGNDGRCYITRIQNGKPVTYLTNTATLRKDEWITLDKAVLAASRLRLAAFADLRAANSYTIGDGMGSTVLQTQRVTDNGEAAIDMDGLSEVDGDRPHFDLANHPLPIIHSGFDLSLRQIMTSRKSGSALDVTMAENCTRRVAEKVEGLVIGNVANFTFGGGTLYGYRTFPDRQTYTITSPTTGGWVPDTLVDELLDARQQLIDAKFLGPFRIYVGKKWAKYLDKDYSPAKGDNTLRQRILSNEGFQSIKTLDYLPDYEILIIQMTSDVARAIVGMEMTTLQWESPNGLKFHFKVMCILNAQIRADIEGNCGLLHATT